MDSALIIHRVHFALAMMFHYILPQLTMGLAPLIVVLKTFAIVNNDENYNTAARFWARIFGLNFALGVVTGIPMEFHLSRANSYIRRLRNSRRLVACHAECGFDLKFPAS